jgi:hypothetical protein
VRPLLLSALLVAGCGPSEPCAGWHSTLAGDAGLQLTQAEHGVAWGQTACFQCHQAWSIHPPDCVEAGWIDPIDQAVDYDDPHTCTSCHGMNGTDDDDWVDATSSAS